MNSDMVLRIFIGACLMFCGLIFVAAIIAYPEAKALHEQCRNSGGVYVSTDSGKVCFDRKAIIEVK